jgi:hypothetical protein
MHSSSADIYASASHVHSTFFSASRLSRVVFLNDHKTACSILFLVAPLYSFCRHIFFLLCRQREDGTVASLLLFSSRQLPILSFTRQHTPISPFPPTRHACTLFLYILAAGPTSYLYVGTLALFFYLASLRQRHSGRPK